MEILRLDHIVLTVGDVAATVDFYQHVLNMQPQQFGDGRWALHFGNQKINLHQAGHEFEPKALYPTRGSADLCFITNTPIQDVIAHLLAVAVPILVGPVHRTGATGRLLSVYLRDPDGNLIEVANRVD